MYKILSIDQAIQITNDLRNQGKKIVLVGGVFDIIHIGHIRFLQEAKRCGDVLVVLLENDETVKRLKGNQRPFTIQKERAEILAELASTDIIIPLTEIKNDDEYDHIVISLKPDIIAVTKDDPNLGHKKRQAKEVSAQIKEVVDRLPYSTSKLSHLLSEA